MIQVLYLLKRRGDKGLEMLLMVVSGYIIWFTYSVDGRQYIKKSIKKHE